MSAASGACGQRRPLCKCAGAVAATAGRIDDTGHGDGCTDDAVTVTTGVVARPKLHRLGGGGEARVILATVLGRTRSRTS